MEAPTETNDSKGLLGFLGRSKGMLVDRWLNFRSSIGSQDISQLESLVQAHPAETYLHLIPRFQPRTTSRIREIAR